MLAIVALSDELERIAAIAQGYADEDERLSGVLAAEPSPGRRVFVCSFDGSEESARSWLALDEDGRPLERREDVRDAVSIVAMCEVAADTAGGGDVGELRTQLVELRLRESPPGIDEAEEAALALERAIGAGGRVASAAYLDEIGRATVRLEQALGHDDGSPFAAAMKEAMGAVQTLAAEVERTYKLALV
jgi:hypothetical protein